MNTVEHFPQVPDQLSHLIDDDFMAVHERWQQVSYADIVESMPEPQETEFGRAVILEPRNEHDDVSTLVLGLPHQQAWKPSMMIRAKYMQDTVAPDSRLIVLPNNTAGDEYYRFSNDEALAIKAGNMKPYFENRVRLLEELDVKGEVDLTGYSLGGMTALGIASVLSDKWNIGIVNADEAPNAIRTPGELQKDFTGSGALGMQFAAIKDAHIPALNEALNGPRITKDYVQFFFGAMNAANMAMRQGMAREDFKQIIERLATNYPDSFTKIGNIEGSKVFRPEALQGSELEASGIMAVTYSGEAARLHPTGDNPVAHALMFKHAVELAEATR